MSKHLRPPLVVLLVIAVAAGSAYAQFQAMVDETPQAPYTALGEGGCTQPIALGVSDIRSL